jgi:predicted ATP-grasp superfamily ATP-dependent carboligase
MSSTRDAGAVVIGGGRHALGFTRSLGARGVPVWVLYEPGEQVAVFSRFVRRHLRFSPRDPAAVDRLLELARRQGLAGWSLLGTDDETGHFLARNRAALETSFRLSVPPLEVYGLAYDKRLTYETAARAGVDAPWWCVPESVSDLADREVPFPAIVKPASKPRLTRLTHEKAWRCDTRQDLLHHYQAAARELPREQIIVQELVPGTGANQLSFAAICAGGDVLRCLTARRLRQYPVDFGRSSTYVETIVDQELVEVASRLLAEMRMDGIVEVELKRDERDGRLKLLDVNPRLWTWHALCTRAGVDFPYLLWLQSQQRSLPACSARVGVRWLRAVTDVLAAARLLSGRQLALGAYARSVRPPVSLAVFDRRDPVPSLAEVPLAGLRVTRRALALATGDDRSGRVAVEELAEQP